jgi:hypothetical protein
VDRGSGRVRRERHRLLVRNVMGEGEYVRERRVRGKDGGREHAGCLSLACHKEVSEIELLYHSGHGSTAFDHFRALADG